MFHFHQAVHQLIYQVQQSSDETPRCSLTLSAPPSFAFPDWLECQTLFPKFFWQDRQGQEEVVALGQCHRFDDPAPAYAVIANGQRIWGGQSFDGGTDKTPDCPESFFFMPLVELIRDGDVWILAVNLSGNKSRAIDALEQLVTTVPELEPVKTGIESVVHLPDEQQWCDLMDKALSEIQHGTFDKVVLARESAYCLKHPVRAAQLLKASRDQNHHSFHFLMAVDAHRSFTGSTPERLYLRVGQTLQTEALAGTTGRGDTPAQDQALADWLIHDDKNIQENQYVVDDIVDHLTPLSREIDTVEQPRLVKLSRVQHLKRRIHARLNPGVNGVHLLSSLQPTAAVAGYPRQAAQAFIAQEEPFSRGWYAGAIGYISHEKAEFCVAIRSALIIREQIRLYAGAGIVPGSVAQEEWQELNRKMSTLLSLMADDEQ
ncbi:isochorismate synthase [Vibrio quintilis]|uniref:Isochorismate synthase MenF n=1 Tax=Vibrio quintilis TaxID=1117707 RepID=A0A1M7YTX1_9VIBR|nr:isochorismate synthase [Vibrio quintilis]SHO56055.1 Menaquinone-specific isochorismate synthase [Vibrio quintilis]